MPIFGDPQNFLKQASSNNNQMSSLTNDNQQTSMNSSTTQEASNQNSQNQIPDMSGDNSQLQDGMNQDMQTGPGTMQDKTGVNNATSFDASGQQQFVHAGDEDMETTTTETVEVKEQSGMAKWIKKKVMGGTEQDTVEQEQGEYSTETGPTASIPEGTDADLKYIEGDKSKMPKAPEPPPHRSNIPKGASINNIPKASMPKAGKMPNARLPKMSMPKFITKPPRFM